MIVPLDLICSPPTSNPVTPLLASIPILTPSLPSQLPTTASKVRLRPNVDLPASHNIASGAHPQDLKCSAQASSPTEPSSLAMDLAMTPIEAFPAALPGTAVETPEELVLPAPSIHVDAPEPMLESTNNPSKPGLRISLSRSAPSDSYAPPAISPTDTGFSAHFPTCSDSSPPPTSCLARPNILTRASHSDAIHPTSATAFGVHLDVKLGSPTVSLDPGVGGAVGRRTSLTFKDAAGRRMGRGSCPNPSSNTGFTGTDYVVGPTPCNTPDKYSRVGVARHMQPRVSVTSSGGGGGVGRRPSWKIAISSPVLAPTLSCSSAIMDRLAGSDGSTIGSEESALLLSDAGTSEGDENAARRTVYTRTPYPMGEEDENADPMALFGDPFAVVTGDNTSRKGKKADGTGGAVLENAMCRLDLHALHPADRHHGPDFDSDNGGCPSSSSQGSVIKAIGVRASLIRPGSKIATGDVPAPYDEVDDIEFIEPFSGSRISVREANSPILSGGGGNGVDPGGSILLHGSGNPVLIRKSSFNTLGRSSTRTSLSLADDGASYKGGEAVSGLPMSSSRSRIASFFTRSRATSPAPPADVGNVGHDKVGRTGGKGSRLIAAEAAIKLNGEPAFANNEEWGSAGMSKQWSVDSQSALEDDGLLI